MIRIGPQAGPQERFLSSPADIVVYGGAAGGGKSYGLLLEPLRHIDNPAFGAVIFRRNANQITNEGGLWDTSMSIYPYAHGRPSLSPRPTWRFPSGAKVTFAHMQYDQDRISWQGSQIAMIGFDELTHFSRKQFFYMLSRNRSLCGVQPYMRATTNPDSDSWVAEFIQWWWDPATGYAIPERSGVIRYMVRINDVIYWGDSPEELIEKTECDPEDCKSVTFIASCVQDNKVLMDKDPGYLANLKAMALIDRERLLYGNWKIRPAAGLFFKRSQVPTDGWLDAVPDDVVRWVRCWDLAATDTDENGDPAYTAGVLIGKRRCGRYVIADVTRARLSAGRARDHILATARMDKTRYKTIKIRLPQDPGQAGKDQAENFIKFLSGFSVVTARETGSKEARAEPFAAQWQHGNVDVVLGPWTEEYLNELEGFPEGKFKDQVDASSDGFAELQNGYTGGPPPQNLGNTKSSYWMGR